MMNILAGDRQASDRHQRPPLASADCTLEPSAAEWATWLQHLQSLGSQFLANLPKAAAFHQPTAAAVTSFQGQVAQARSLGDLLTTLVSHQAENGLLAASGRHLGFIPGGGLPLAAIADHLAALVNDFSGDAFVAPIACEINRQVITWLAELVGYDTEAFGDITSGGSQATLTALMVAREAHGLKPANYHRYAAYLGQQSHHCLTKSLRVLCGDAVNIRLIASGPQGMDPAALTRQILADREAGLTPWLLAATAGTTNLGILDPLAELADIAASYGLWLHTDGAYGGFFSQCTDLKAKFAGLERADSLVLDPHKGMFLPYGSGALLVKNGNLLRRAMAGDAAYLQDRTNPADLPSPMDYSLELSRPFRALRLWLVIQYYGLDRFAAAWNEKRQLAVYLAEAIKNQPDLELYADPQLSIVAFRHRRGPEASQALGQHINNSGQAFISSTTIAGTYWLRVAVLSFRTDQGIIDDLLAVITTWEAT